MCFSYTNKYTYYTVSSCLYCAAIDISFILINKMNQNVIIFLWLFFLPPNFNDFSYQFKVIKYEVKHIFYHCEIPQEPTNIFLNI